jgi:hypothetical protein
VNVILNTINGVVVLHRFQFFYLQAHGSYIEILEVDALTLPLAIHDTHAKHSSMQFQTASFLQQIS